MESKVIIILLSIVAMVYTLESEDIINPYNLMIDKRQEVTTEKSSCPFITCTVSSHRCTEAMECPYTDQMCCPNSNESVLPKIDRCCYTLSSTGT
ncbi:hypothetical protein CHUAL_005988 [Chamberlinius hualienensis]